MWYNCKPQHITKETTNYYTTKNPTLEYHILNALMPCCSILQMVVFLGSGFVQSSMPFQCIITCCIWEQSCGSWVHQIGDTPHQRVLMFTFQNFNVESKWYCKGGYSTLVAPQNQTSMVQLCPSPHSELLCSKIATTHATPCKVLIYLTIDLDHQCLDEAS